MINKNLLSLYIFMFSWGLANGIIAPIFPLYLRLLGISIMEFGVMLAIFALGMTLFEPIWGFLSDGRERLYFIIAPTFIAAIIIPLYTLKILIPYFIFLQFIRGSFIVMFGPTSRALISDSVPIKNLGKAMGIWYSSRGLGVIIGSLLGSKIAELFSYEMSFYLFSLVSLITGIYGIYWLRHNYKNSSVNRNEKVPISFPIRRVFKELIANDSIIKVFLLAIIALVSRGVNDSFVPIFASEILMASTFEIGIVNAFFNGVCVVMTPILGNLSDKMSRKQVIVIALIFMSASFVSYSFITKLTHLILVIIINAIGFSLLLPSLLAFLAELVSKDIIGSAMGIFGSCEDFGIMIGPLLFSFIWSTSGPIYAFHTITVLLVFGVILAIYLKEKN